MRASADAAQRQQRVTFPASTWLYKQLDDFPPLTRAAEGALAVRIAAGVDCSTPDQPRLTTLDAREAAGQLVSAQFRWAYTYSLKESEKYKIPFEDVIAEAYAGLLDAAMRFDHTRGFKFLTFAAWWIKARVSRRVINDFSLVKVGTTHWQRVGFFNSEEGAELKGSVPGRAGRVMHRDLSLHAPLRHDNDGQEFVDNLPDAHDARDHLEQRNLRARAAQGIAQGLAGLNLREQRIVKARFLQGESTLDALAQELGVTRERVRQLESAAFAKLRVIFRTDRRMRDVLRAYEDEGTVDGTARVHAIDRAQMTRKRAATRGSARPR